MDYDNTNRGVLFRNDRKETDKHPDFTGSIDFEGRDCWLSAWVKESKAGTKFFSLSLTPKDGSKPMTTRKTEISDIDEDLPF